MKRHWDRVRAQHLVRDDGSVGAMSAGSPVGRRHRRGRVARRAALAVLASVALVAPLMPAASAQSRGVGTVVIANGWSPADSAVASALAALEGSGSTNAAVLYARSGELTARTSAFISNHKPAKAILVGGTSALSASVAEEVAGLLGGTEPDRISGSDRFDTAAKAVPSEATTFVVANGYSAADTGVAAALAAVTPNAAVLLSAASSLTAPTEQVIASRQPTAVIFVGGTAVLGESLVERVRELAPSVTEVPRHSGSSRTHTAALAAPDTAATLVIANGWSAADSGVAAALAATTGNAAVLYAKATSLTAPTAIRISAVQPRAVILVGGTSALGSVLHRSIHCRVPGASISRVSGSDRIDTAARAASGTMATVDTSFDCGVGGGGGGGGGGVPATSPGSVAPTVTPPSPPSRLGAMPTNMAIEMSWSEPSNGGRAITGYTVQYRKCSVAGSHDCSGGTWGDWHTASKTTTVTSLTVNGPMQTEGINDGKPTTTASLTNGTAYQVRVRARNTVGEGGWSASAQATPEGTPGAPTNVKVTARFNTSLVVDWTAPMSNGGLAINDYDVQYRACTATDGDSSVLTCATTPTWGGWTEWNAANTSTTTTATITGLTNGTAYQVQVRAGNGRTENGNAVGDGPWSPSATGTPAAVPEAPSAPTLTAGDGTISPTWTAPATNGSDITDYDVQYRTCKSTGGDTSVLTCASTPAWNSWTDRTGETAADTAVSVTLSSLTNGTAHQVRVRAANIVGESPWSPASSAAVPAGGKPSAPTGLTVKAKNATTLTASWNAANGNGKAIIDYDVRYCRTGCDADTQWTILNDNGSFTALTADISPLGEGSEYQVQVRAANSEGESAWSSTAKGTPGTPAAPAAPTVNDPTAQDRQLVVSWTAPASNGAAISDYDVRYRACTATPKTCASSPAWGSWSNHSHSGTGRTATVTGRSNGTKYQVQVRASNSNGTGLWSPSGSAIPAAAPTAAPGNLTTVSGDELLTVSWTAPFDNGSPITGYDIDYCGITSTEDCSEYSTWQGTGDPGAATATTITGLTNGVTYKWRVRAQNILGWSNTWSSDASGKPATVPGAPSILELVGNDKSVTFTWAPPQDDGGLTVNDYDVRYRVTDTNSTSPGNQPGDWTDAGHSGTSTTATISGLTNGTRYDVAVRAGNGVGKGEWSARQDRKAGGAPLAPAQPTVASGDTALTVSWTAPSDNGGGDITGYVVEYCTGTGTGCSTSSVGTVTEVADTTPAFAGATTVTLTGLTNGTSYRVTVRAVNKTGDGALSPVAVSTAAGTPDAPDDVAAVGTDQTLTVTWNEPAANGATVTGFEVRHCTGNSDCAEATDVLATTAVSGASSRSVAITGLTNGVRYDAQVRTVSSGHGKSAWSSDEASDTAGSAPSQPTSLRVASANTRLTAYWSAPSANGGWPISSYDIQYCNATSTGCDDDDEDWTSASVTRPTAPAAPTVAAGNAQIRVSWAPPVESGWTVTDYDVRYRACTATDKTCAASPSWGSWTNRTGETASDTATSVAITGLTNGTAYQAQVRAANSVGESSWSASGSAAPAADAVPPVPPVPQPSVLTTSSQRITGLTNGTTYHVRVRARNTNTAKGGGPWTSAVSAKPATTPSKPTGVMLTSGNRSLTVKWATPVSNGSNVTGFQVRYCEKNRLDANDQWIECSNYSNWSSNFSVAGSLARQTTLSGLTNGKEHLVEVRVVSSGHGNSAWTAWDQLNDQQGSNMPGVPSTPTISSVTAGNNQLTLNWSAPSGNGDDINGYEVHYCNSSVVDCTEEQHWSDNSRVTGTPTSHTISGGLVQNGTAYKLRLRASNSRGSSQWSNIVTATPSA